MSKVPSRYVIELLSKPAYRLYSGSLRTWKYHGLDILVLPGIFHPGWFVTSRMLLDTLENMDVTGRSFLELGCGTGTQACRSAQKGAISFASDITPAACKNARLNAERNGLDVAVITSDIFSHFPEGLQFDIIFANPPFLKAYPEDEKDFAFCAGEEYEYYISLFQDLKKHLLPGGQLIMALAESCEIRDILEIADSEEIAYEKIGSKRRWSETNHLFRFTV